MKNKLLLFSSLAFVMLCFNGCNPDEVQDNLNQQKLLTVRVTLSEPIPASSEFGFTNLTVIGMGGITQSLDGSISNQIGQNEVVISSNAFSNTNQIVSVYYTDLVGIDADGNENYDCDIVTAEVTYDGNVILTEQKDLGGFCGDGFEWQLSFITP